MKGIAINFVTVGARYAFRRMDYVPRVGEFVSLNTPKDGVKNFEVTKVIHDVSSDNENHWQVYVWIKTPVPDGRWMENGMNNKVKIISGTNYQKVEDEVNDFIRDKIISDIKVCELYDFDKDIGFVTYHILYSEFQGRTI